MPRAPEAWYRGLARGAGAGAAATVLMSAVQFPGARAARRFPPPVEITRRLHHLTGRAPDRGQSYARGVALHLAFGAGCGALYALLAPRRFRELTATGYAAALYGASSRGSLPLLSLHAHTRRDDPRRQLTNLAAHLVYGITLAEILRLTDPSTDDDDGASGSGEGLDEIAARRLA
jgi:hypothetical protein